MPSFHRIHHALYLVLFSCLAAPASAQAEPVAASAQPARESTTSTSTSSGPSDAESGGFEILPMEPPPAAPITTAPSAPAAEPLPHGERERAAPAARREPEREWYGWQTLSADAASFGMMFLGAESAPGLVILGLGSFALAPPIIHAVHQGDWTAPSLALRLGGLGLIFGGAVVAFGGSCLSFGDDETPSNCDERAILGAGMAITGLASALSAVVLDAVFARAEPRRPGTPTLALWTNPPTHSAGISLTVVQ
jgi:hypothetical protein